MKKTNKTFKRFAAITSASLLAACAVAPVFTSMTSYAEETKTTITINDPQENASKNYTGYKLLTASVDTKSDPNSPAYTYAVNPTFRGILKTVAKVEDTVTEVDEIDAAILEYISELDSTTGVEAGEMRTFGDAVYNAILEANLTLSEEDMISTTTGSFSNVSQGYYLIAQQAPTGKVDATASLVMVDTAGDTTLEVTVKKDFPSFDKFIGDINDTDKTISGTWNEADYTWSEDADHDKYSSDAVPFRLVATLPSDYASYNCYTLSFHDDLQADVFGNREIKAVYIVDKDGNKIKDLVETTDYTVGDGCGSTHSSHGDGCDFTLTIDDLTIYDDVDAEAKVIVEYTAPFTASTVLGSDGNWNTGLLEYSNNPYNSGVGEADNTTSKTPDDSVVAYSYEVVIDKTKGDGTTALTGAQFELYKATAVNGDADDGYDWEVTSIPVVLNEAKTKFTFSGIDDGVYKLVESVVPQGYNGIDPIIFEVTATHENETLKSLNGTPEVDGAIAFTADTDYSTLSAIVKNNSGLELPGTGGIGTTIFYLGGGAMAAIGGIYLISKRRMKKSEE